ncbi:hypothetical protein NPX89_31490, partial [Bacillus mycoides]|nr:hypothetical protein [Bacillus mycoides]
MLDKVQVKTKELIVEGSIKQATDTRWTNLTTTGVETLTERPLKYKRSGNQIAVIGSARNAKSVQIFAT